MAGLFVVLPRHSVISTITCFPCLRSRNNFGCVIMSTDLTSEHRFLCVLISIAKGRLPFE